MTVEQPHLDWSHKQRRILTANGRASEYYHPARGFPFDETELPHYHLMRRDNHGENETLIFEQWRDQDQAASPIVGTWFRPYFGGGPGVYEESSSHEERTYNIQTRTLFVDLRIPHSKSILFEGMSDDLNEWSTEQLRWYARQHVFAGYTRVFEQGDTPLPWCAVRHHCLDWNFVGVGRDRPNKWWIDLPAAASTEPKTWKEWSYATDDAGQFYYCERWERLDDSPLGLAVFTTPVAAFRRRVPHQDGVIVVVGNHFNYCLCHESLAPERTYTSLVDLVDGLIENGNHDLVRKWLKRIQGGHGRIEPGRGWVIDAAIEFWREGSLLWTPDQISIHGGTESNDNSSDRNMCFRWNDEQWDVFECNLPTIEDLASLMLAGSPRTTGSVNRSLEADS
jgi:hypothetical protein